MTMKPKAEKYRTRRSEHTAAASGAADGNGGAAPTSDDFGAAMSFSRAKKPPKQAADGKAAQTNSVTASLRSTAPPAAGQASASEDAAHVAAELKAIREEGLTGRQLRMARRVAQRYEIEATSDVDAVRLLRQRGIDPFQRVNMLELVVPGEGAAPPPPPQPASGNAQVPSTEMASPMERRVREISEIQRDIARRRRRKTLQLMSRLMVFVMLPTLICGYYFYNVATPMYATKSAFMILKADGGGSIGPSLLGSSPLSTAQDSVAVQDYLTSKDAMIRLDHDLGFKEHFSREGIDPVQRLDPGASNERAHRLFRKNVKIGFDPTEGVIRMEVRAATPQMSVEFSRELIRYAEERVDGLTQRKRENQLKDSQLSLDRAESARRKAQERLVKLQLENGLIDPEGEITSLRSQISGFETQLREKRLELQALLDNARPNRAKVDGAKGDISRLEATIDDLRAEMNQADETGRSLADLAAQIQLAKADLATRDLMLSEALAQLSSTRSEAASQVRYLTISVEPVTPEDASYPRKFENTAVSFLVFCGIYLMLSLTVSILREQISS